MDVNVEVCCMLCVLEIFRVRHGSFEAPILQPIKDTMVKAKVTDRHLVGQFS